MPQTPTTLANTTILRTPPPPSVKISGSVRYETLDHRSTVHGSKPTRHNLLHREFLPTHHTMQVTDMEKFLSYARWLIHYYIVKRKKITNKETLVDILVNS